MVDVSETGAARTAPTAHSIAVPPASRLDRAFTWLYTRHRRRYLWTLVAITALGVECVVPLLAAAIGPVVTRGTGHLQEVLAILLVASCLGIPSMCWVVASHHAPALRYLRGDDPPPTPDEVWRTSVAELARGVSYVVCGYWVPLSVGALVVGYRIHASTLLALVLVYAVTVSSGLVGVFFFLVWETALRPLAREVAPSLSPDLLSRNRGPSISVKLFILLTLTSLFNGFVVGSLSLVSGSHEERAILAVLSSVAVSVTLAATVIWLLRRSFVTRVEEIRRALDLVEAGSREGLSLAPLAGDDLDDVTKSFNGMIRRLQQQEDDMRASRARIVSVADIERRRVERDLHDGAQQYLALMGLQVSNLAELLPPDSPLAADVEELRSTLTDAQAELRNLAHGIYPASLESEGVAAALREAGARATVPVDVDARGVGQLPRETAAAVYFVCLEALQNVSKHAGPEASAHIRLAASDHRVEFSVADDGIGFDVDATSHGLVNMRDRIGALGGDVTIRSRRGEGTSVTGWVPVEPTTLA